MPVVRRIANSCVTVTTDDGTTLFDPGSFSWSSDEVDLDTIGDVQRVLVTHTHPDHLEPAFVRWLVDRGDDVAVHGNDEVAAALAAHDVEVLDAAPDGVSAEDVLHERIPTGARPPNRAWTIGGVFTHPGDSYEPTTTAPVLALPLVTPWGSMTASVEFATRLGPAAVVPIHDFYLSASGRQAVMAIADRGFEGTGVELMKLDWGDSATV